MQDRLRHMALHFAKYAGRLSDHPDKKVVKKTTIDTLIIAVSCANILNMDLSKKPLRPAGEEMGLNEFSRSLTVAAGKMAGACERIDHLEDFPFRKVIAEQVQVILAAAIAFMVSNGWDVVSVVENRLAGVKAKSIFHGRL
ncbi:MAG: hypothetical protein RID07_04155 [Lacipirellulaceae bacterium]